MILVSSRFTRSVQDYDNRLMQMDDERRQQLRRFEQDTEEDRLNLATMFLKRQSIQRHDPQLLESKDDIEDDDDDENSDFDEAAGDDLEEDNVEERVEVGDSQWTAGSQAQSRSASLEWKLREPLEQYDPLRDANGNPQPGQQRRKKRLRSKTKPVKFKYIVRSFLWAVDLGSTTVAPSSSDEEAEDDPDVERIAEAVGGGVGSSGGGGGAASSSTPPIVVMSKGENAKINKIRRKALLNATLPESDKLLSIDLEQTQQPSTDENPSFERATTTTSAVPPQATTNNRGGSSVRFPKRGEGLGAKHLQPERVCYAVTVELVERQKVLGASHDDEQAEHECVSPAAPRSIVRMHACPTSAACF